VPAYSGEMEFGEMGRKLANKEFEVEGRNFVLASKKGRRTSVMEDGYGVMLDILGDPKQVGDHHALSMISLRRVSGFRLRKEGPLWKRWDNPLFFVDLLHMMGRQITREKTKGGWNKVKKEKRKRKSKRSKNNILIYKKK
jgi:hypothetical protein